MIRKMKRDKLRKKYGNKSLRVAWYEYQKKKYGKDFYRICRNQFM